MKNPGMWFYRPEWFKSCVQIENLNRHVPGFKKVLGWYTWPNIIEGHAGNLDDDIAQGLKRIRYNWI